jgi:hypothetical protein
MPQIVPTHREDWKTYFQRLTKNLVSEKASSLRNLPETCLLSSLASGCI